MSNRASFFRYTEISTGIEYDKQMCVLIALKKRRFAIELFFEPVFAFIYRAFGFYGFFLSGTYVRQKHAKTG